MNLSPAQLLKRYLVANGLVDDVAPNKTWQCFISSMPDKPDQCVAIYDTGGVPQGRLMAGATQGKPTIQVKVRATDYPTAFAKITALATACDGIYKFVVNETDYDFVLHAVHHDPVIPMGRGDDPSKREHFSFNCLATLTAVQKP